MSFSALLLVAGCAVGGFTANAADYLVQPSVSGQLTQNDNLLLSSDGREIETVLLELTPRLRVRRSTEKWRADFDGSFTFVRMEDEVFDSDNQNVSLQLTRSFETVMMQMVALNSRESTRSVELDQLGEIGFQVERRDRQYLRPSVTWTFNPTNQISFGVAGENVHYGGFEFSDYDYYSADIAWTHQFDEKTRFEVSTFGTDYASSPPQRQLGSFAGCFAGLGVLEDFSSDTIGVRVGASRQADSRLSYRGSVGYREVETTAAGGCLFAFGDLSTFSNSSTSDGLVLDAGVNYVGESYELALSLSRSVSPAGLGFITERDDIRIDWGYRYSERIRFGLGASSFDTESLDPDTQFARDGLRISPNVVWRVDERINLTGGLVFRTNESLTTPGEREGFSAYVRLNYDFKPTRFSR